MMKITLQFFLLQQNVAQMKVPDITDNAFEWNYFFKNVLRTQVFCLRKVLQPVENSVYDFTVLIISYQYVTAINRRFYIVLMMFIDL